MENSRILGTLPNRKVIELNADWGGNLVTISHEHLKVHQSELLATGYLATGVAAAGDIEVLFQCPSTHDLHLYIRMAAGADATFTAFEGPTINAQGTVLTPINHNRNGTDSANATITHTPTLGADGSQLWEQFFPGGTGGASPGVIEPATTEQVVLKAGNNYLFRLTNNDGAGQTLNMLFSFYEIAV